MVPWLSMSLPHVNAMIEKSFPFFDKKHVEKRRMPLSSTWTIWIGPSTTTLPSFTAKMKYFKLIIAILASAPFASAAAHMQNANVCVLSKDNLIWMKNAIMYEDNPDKYFGYRSHCRSISTSAPGGFFSSNPQESYSLQRLLEDAIRNNRIQSFNFLYPRARSSPGVHPSSLFHVAYMNYKADICDMLMKEMPQGVAFWGVYGIDDLKRIAHRYPHEIHRFIPKPSDMSDAGPLSVTVAIDLIAYCRALSEAFAHEEEYRPSSLLLRVMANEDLSDEDMANIIQRLFNMGAELDTNSEHSALNRMALIEGMQAEFRRLYPNHRKSYQLLFGEEEACTMSDELYKYLSDIVRVQDSPQRLSDAMGPCRQFKIAGDILILDNIQKILNEMIDLNRLESFKFLFPRAMFAGGAHRQVMFSHAIQNHRPDICDYLLTRDFDIRHVTPEFWNKGSSWTVEELNRLATNNPGRVTDMIPSPRTVKETEDADVVKKMIAFILHGISVCQILADDQSYRRSIIENIIPNELIKNNDKEDIIRRISMNNLRGHGESLFNLAIKSKIPHILLAVLDNKQLEGSREVIETAVKIAQHSMMALLFNDSRFKRNLPLAFYEAARQDKPDALEYLLKLELGNVAPGKKVAVLKSVISGIVEKNRADWLLLLQDCFTNEQMKEAISLKTAKSAVRRKAWGALGALMAVQFTEEPVIVPHLLVGLQMVLIAVAKEKYKGNLQALNIADQAKRIEKIYKFGPDSKELEEYLEGFWSTYDELKINLRCADWLMRMFRKDKPLMSDLLAISKAITPKVKANSKPEDLAKIAKNAMQASRSKH
jgi:hypothetical protein